MRNAVPLPGANTIWVLTIFGWTACMMVPFFYLLKLMGQLRVSPEDEAVSRSLVPVSMSPGMPYPAPATWLPAPANCSPERGS